MSKEAAFNSAAQMLGERILSGLSDSGPLAKKLHGAWDSGAPNSLLSSTDWQWCRKTVEITYDPSAEALFGYEYAHKLPENARHSGVYTNEMLSGVLKDYQYEDGYIHSHYEIIYFQYVPIILDIPESKWPSFFIDYLGAELAKRVSPDVDNQTKQGTLDAEHRRRKIKAENDDAMLQPTKPLPSGSWTTSRSYGRRTYTGRP